MKSLTSKIINKENYTLPSKNNPLMNVMPTDYTDNPNKKAVPFLSKKY